MSTGFLIGGFSYTCRCVFAVAEYRRYIVDISPIYRRYRAGLSKSTINRRQIDDIDMPPKKIQRKTSLADSGGAAPGEICGLLLLPVLVLACSWILVVYVQGATAPADVAYEEAPAIFSRACCEAHANGEFLQHRHPR